MTRFFILKRGREIKEVFNKGRSVANPCFVLYLLPNGKNYNKVAFCVGKAAGKAVVRNHIRRRTREAFRQVEAGISPGYNLVIIARPGVDKIQFELLKSFLVKVFRQAGIYGESGEK
mgnify:CR=1 FL=1